MQIEPRAPMVDFVVLSLLVAHAADSEFDYRESQAVLSGIRKMTRSSTSGSDVVALIKAGALAYQHLRVGEVDEIARRAGAGFAAEDRLRAFEALSQIAAADGVQHTMEVTILRHIGNIWNIGEAVEKQAASAAGVAA